MLRQRLVGLDYLRVGLVVQVFLFHAWLHLHCSFGFLTPFIRMGSTAMTGFFMLSGFALGAVYQNHDFSSWKACKGFWYKRLCGIWPLYLVVSILSIVFYSDVSLAKNIVLGPVLVLGYPTVFTSLFNVAPVSGTWFISCILFCYLLFPFLISLVRQMSRLERVALLGVVVIVFFCGVAAQHVFRLASIYTNPFFRILEFVVGIVLWMEAKKIRDRWSTAKCMSMTTCAVVVMVVGITIGLRIPIAPGDPMVYSVVVLPCFACLIVSLAAVDFRGNRLLDYLSGASYAFFLGQFFCYDLTLRTLSCFCDSNLMRLTLSFVLNVIISVSFYELVQKPCKRMLM